MAVILDGTSAEFSTATLGHNPRMERLYITNRCSCPNNAPILVAFFSTDATTHCGFVFYSPLAGYNLLAYEVS